MIKKETIGVLTNPDGFLWLLELTQGHNISIGIEEFEGKLVKVMRTQEKLIIEVIKEVEPVLPRARELCMVASG